MKPIPSMVLLLAMLPASCGNAQRTADTFEPAKLIAAHFGAAPTPGSRELIWKPSATDAGRFDHLPLGTVATTVDTVLHPSEDVALVFFRTAIRLEPDEFSSMCDLCEDWLSLARYTKGANGWAAGEFNKWFTKQGVFDFGLEESKKPILVETGRTAKAVRIISSDGEPEHSRTTHHFFGIPDLREALAITTGSLEVTRGGPYGPMEELIFREYRFIPSDKDWHDVEVLTRDTEVGKGTPSYLAYSSTAHKYVAAKPPAR